MLREDLIRAIYNLDIEKAKDVLNKTISKH